MVIWTASICPIEPVASVEAVWCLVHSWSFCHARLNSNYTFMYKIVNGIILIYYFCFVWNILSAYCSLLTKWRFHYIKYYLQHILTKRTNLALGSLVICDFTIGLAYALYKVFFVASFSDKVNFVLATKLKRNYLFVLKLPNIQFQTLNKLNL